MRTLVVVSLVLLVGNPALFAQDEDLRRVFGVVKSFRADRLAVETREGEVVSVRLGPKTRFEGPEGPASASALRLGARVVVDASRRAGGRWEADLVRIGVQEPVPAPSPAPPHAGHRPAAPDRDRPHAAHGRPAEKKEGAKPEAGHAQHGPPASPAPPAGHEGHAAGAAGGSSGAPAGGPHAGHAMMPEGMERNLFQSDMWMMAGMTPRDPMAGMAMRGWDWMTMGVARLQYNRQGGASGDEAVESTNWTMVMGQRDVGRGRFTLMTMNSLEPATLEDAGTPQLFQTGETFQGRPLVDRQHPHDLFMNLSATYRAPIGEHSAWWVQAALRGEPALGPTAFMHRASAGENPAAILGHHFQDSTHITDDVITVGAGWRWLSVDASVFHGQEPDEGRWDLDPGGLDSVAGRVKVALDNGWSAQVSHGFLEAPEALEEGDVRRTTASLHYGERGDRPLAASFVWGHNREEHGTFNSFLLEGAYQLTANDHLYGRAEHVDRDRHLLESKGLTEAEPEGGEDDILSVRALTFGYLRELRIFRDVRWLDVVNVGVGGDLTFYGVPDALRDVYGDSPVSVHGFLRLRWGRPHGARGHGMGH